MAGATAEKTDPRKWEKVKKQVTASDKGGKPGQWSARKAQMAVAEYKKEGGGYRGKKTEANHLTQWTKEEWGTKSEKGSGKTGERYLPKKVRESLTEEQYARTTAKKRQDTAKGKQFSAQPTDVAKRATAARKGAPTTRAAAGTTGRETATTKAGTARKAPRSSAQPAANLRRAKPAERQSGLGEPPRPAPLLRGQPGNLAPDPPAVARVQPQPPHDLHAAREVRRLQSPQRPPQVARR